MDEIPHFLAGEVAGGGSLAVFRSIEIGVTRGSEHDHLLQPLELHDVGLYANDTVCALCFGFFLDSLEREVAGVIEDVAVLFDFAPYKRAEAAHDSSAKADGVGDVSESERDGSVAAIKLTVDFLTIGATGEFEGGGVDAFAVNGGPNAEEFDIATVDHELAGHPADAYGAIEAGPSLHAVERGFSAVMNDVGDLGDLAAADSFEGLSDSAHEPDGPD